MPLIAITGRDEWYPGHPKQPNPAATTSRELGDSLLKWIAAHPSELYLDPSTPATSAQVTFHGFSPYDLNVPQIWVLAIFSQPLADHRQLEVRNRLADIIKSTLSQAPLVPTEVAIDVHFCAGHGQLWSPGLKHSW